MNLSVETTNILLIGAMEMALLFVLITLFLIVQNRSLKKLIEKLRSRLQHLIAEIKKVPQSNEPKPGKYDKTYPDFLSQQIKTTKSRHLALSSNQDISLDIDLSVPLPRRVAALRFAVLQAEKETNRDGNTDWDALQNKYELLFSYFEDYAATFDAIEESAELDEPAVNVDSEEIELLTQELTNAKKRINNLEKFKALYFDLDERWQASKDKASKSYNELTQISDQLDNAEEYERLLKEHHSAYHEFGEMFEKGVQSQEDVLSLEEARGEIRHLRSVAEDQHTVISKLQKRLEESTTDEEKAEVVGELQHQLTTQIRYVQESETCVKLLEDELANSHKEIEQLQSRVSVIPNLKAELNELKDKNEEFDQFIYSLKADNRRLSQKLEKIAKSPPPESAELPKYKKALADLQSKYNDLEERYLDLKIQQ